MAGYSTINAQFRPLSYQEMLQPVLQATEAHLKLLELEDMLMSKAMELLTKIDAEPEGSKAKQLYTNYMNLLLSAALELASLGLTPGSRNILSQLRTNYMGLINPISEAIMARLKLIERLDAQTAADYTTMYNRKASDMTLDEFMANPNLNYETIKGSDISKRVATVAAQYADQILLNTQLTPKDKAHLEYIKKYGFRPQDIQDARAGKGGVISDIVNNVLQSTGIDKWSNYNDIKQNALQYAYEGAGAGVGKEERSLTDNPNYLNPLQQLLKEKLLSELNALKNPPKNPLYTPSTHQHGDIKLHDKNFTSIREKLFTTEGENPYAGYKADIFGKEGKINPVKLYEDVDNYLVKQGGLKEYNSKIKELYDKKFAIRGENGSKYRLLVYDLKGHEGEYYIQHVTKDGNYLNLTPKDIKEISALQVPYYNTKKSAETKLKLISTNEYKALKTAGITAKDTPEQVMEKMAIYQSKLSFLNTGYDLKISDYTDFAQTLLGNIKEGSTNFTELDENLNKIKPNQTGSLSDHWLKKDLFTPETFKVDNIKRVEYVPKAGGLVVFTNDNKQFLLNKGAYNDLLDYINNDAKEVNYWIEVGYSNVDPTTGNYIRDPETGLVMNGFLMADMLIRGNIETAIPQITHSSNPIASKTSKKPFAAD